ncbi:hypothetical protein MKX08_007756 [Trichoderma sp. CBMAI-0020]|nr:hypothetical protein MKX08_007756 [Trichoderma sp. CBMAI-0020]
MLRWPDLVRDTRLSTKIEDDVTIHHHEDSDDENNARSTWREERWKMTVRLGYGGCGSVWLQECIDGKQGIDRRAVKVIPRMNLKNKKDNYVSELEAIAKFSQKRYSKCFVKLLGWYDDDASNLYIAMEYFPLGDLQKYMDKPGLIDEVDVREISFQVLEGLSYMHREGFAHRDIKPDNVLIRSQPPTSKWWVKISDFGISKRVEGSNKVVSSIKGTIPYMAPELLFHEPSSPNPINHQAADMWALGEMAYRLLTKTAVFPTQNAIIRYLVDTNLFPTDNLNKRDASLDAVAFIRALMEPHPDKRLASGTAMEHAWVAPLQGYRAHVSKPSTPIPLDPSVESRQPVPAPNSNSWATASTTSSSYQPYTGVPRMSNVSSLQMSPPVHSGKEIETTHSSDENNTAGNSIHEPVLNVPQVSVSPLGVSQAPQSPSPPVVLNRSQPSPLKMPWPRSALPKGPPPVRLGQSRSQSVQENPPTKPRSQDLIERPKSVEAASCTQCLTPFSSTNKKYQCPNCKNFFDDKCSSKKMMIWWVGLEPVRVDDECFARLSGEKLLVDETFDLCPYLEKIKRELFDEYAMVRNRRSPGRIKPLPKTPVEAGRLKGREELEEREFDRLLSALDIYWPTKPSKGDYNDPKIYEKEFGKYVREVEQNLEMMEKRAMHDQEQRAKKADTRSAGQKLKDLFKFANEEKKETA